MKLFQDSHTNNKNEKVKGKGQRPKDLTNVLMYSEKKRPNTGDSAEDEKSMADDEQCNEENQSSDKKQKNTIFAKLENAVLCQKDMDSEGYPLYKNLANAVNQNKRGDDDDNMDALIGIENKISTTSKKIHEYIEEQKQREHTSTTDNKDSLEMTKRISLEDFTSLIYTPDESEKIIKSLHHRYICSESPEEVKLDLSDNNLKNCDIIMDKRLFVPIVLNQQDQHCSTYVPNVYALDCEMVKTKIGSELARVSLVKLDPTTDEPERCIILLDSYVKPKNYVLDYVTE